MTETTQRIDELVFRSRVEGDAATKAALDGLAQAHGKAADAAGAHATTTETVGKKMLDVERALANEQKRLAGAPQAWRDYERSIATASRALEQGKLDAQAYGRMISEIQARLQKTIAPTIGLTVDQSGVARLLDGQKQISAETRRATKELLDQAGAQQAAAAEAARAQAMLVDQAKRLRTELDPTAAAQQKLNAQLAQYQALADAGAIDAHELAAAQAMANKQFADAVKPIRAVNDNVRLTGDQVRNLGFQVNDAATMLASGSSLAQVAATQFGQVFQALGDGPGGVRGSLAAIGASILGFMTPLNLAVGGMAALGAGVLYFTSRGGKSIPPVTDAMEAHRKAVTQVAAAYGIAADEAEKMTRVSGGLANFNARISREQLELSARSSLRNGFEQSFMEGVTGERIFGGRIGGEGRDALRVYEQFAAFEAPLDRLFEGMAKGTAQADKFVDEVARIANLDPANAELQKAAERLIKIAAEAAEAQRQLRGLGAGFAQAAADAKAFAAAAADLGSFIPDERNDVEKIEQAYGQMMRLARTEADVTKAQDMRRLSLDALTAKAKEYHDQAKAAGAAIGLSKDAQAIAEINARYDELIKNVKGHTDSLIELENARDQEIANIGRQTAFDAGTESHERADTYRKETQARLDGIRQTVAGLETERAALSMSESEAEGYRFQMEALAAAKAAAAEAGKVVSPEEVAAITAAAGEVSRLTGEIEAMREAQANAERLKEFMGDLDFDVSIAKLPEVEQQIQRQLRDLSVTAESVDGQRIAGQMRYLDSLENVRDELGALREAGVDAFTDMADAILSGEDALDSLIGTFAGLGRDLISAQLKSMFGGLFGQPSAAGAGAVGGVSIPGVSVPVAAAAPTAASAAVAALNTSLGKTADGALAVARQFEGLNERADSGALDAFLRASGTWKGLSASDTAWCASFANAAIMKAGGQGTGSNLASSFLNWGQATNAPQIGDIVVLKPQSAGASGHVGFVAGFGDGRVQVFGGNQSNAVNTKSFGLDQVAGYRTGAGISTDMLAHAVSAGNIDAAKKAAAGAVPGLGASSWGSQFNDVQTVSPNVNLGGGIGAGGGMGMGMTALGAGLGIFSAGAQSGSPIMGALGGALGGFQAGAAMGAGLGPVGAVVGGIVGLVGGLFGKSKQKKQEEEARKQREAQQAQMAAQLASQIEDLEAYFGRSPDDNMASELRDVDQKIRELRASIKNDGIKSEDQVDAIEREAVAYKEMLRSEFRDVFDQMSGDLGGGLGLDSEFAKARDSIRTIGKQVRGFVEDTREAYRVPTELKDAILADYEAAEAAANKAYGTASRRAITVRAGNNETYTIDDRREAEAALAEAEKSRTVGLKKAAAERDKALAEYEASVAEMQRRYDEAVATAMQAATDALLRAISGDVPDQTDIEKALDQSRGAAAAAGWELQQLGHSAEEAGRKIEQALGQRAVRLRDDFVKSLQDQIDELDGKGYLASFRDLMEERDNLLKDAGLVGADPALVSTYFAKAAQDLVDGSDLAVEAFDDLIALFPELAGVVRRVGVDLAALKGRIEGYDDRRFAATVDTSTLAGAMADFNRRSARERYAEGLAGGEGMFALDAALAAEKVAMVQRLLVQARQEEVQEIESTISRLESLSKEWGDLRKRLLLDPNLSPLDPRERFLEAQRQFRETAAKAAGTGPEAEEAQAELASISQKYLDEARSFYGSTEAYYAAFDEVQRTLASAETIANQQLAAQRAALDIAQKQLDAMEGVKDSVADLAKALDAAIAQMKAASTAAGVVPGAGGGAGGAGSGVSSFVPKNELESFLGAQYASILGRAPDAGALDFYAKVRATGATAAEIIAMIKASPEAKGRGFMGGGYTGAGPRDQIAGVVHREEVVWNQDDVARAGGVAAVEAMRMSPIPVPVLRLPKMSMPALPRMSGDGSAAVVGAIGRLERRLDRISDVVMADGAETRASIERGNRIAGKTSQTLQLGREAA